MKRRKEIITIIFGLLAALVILIGQSNYYNAQEKARAETKTSDDTTTEESDKAQLKIFSNDAVSTVVHFSFNQVLHFISNCYAEVVDQIVVRISNDKGPAEYFEVLFQRIISPNAP